MKDSQQIDQIIVVTNTDIFLSTFKSYQIDQLIKWLSTFITDDITLKILYNNFTWKLIPMKEFIKEYTQVSKG